MENIQKTKEYTHYDNLPSNVKSSFNSTLNKSIQHLLDEKESEYGRRFTLNFNEFWNELEQEMNYRACFSPVWADYDLEVPDERIKRSILNKTYKLNMKGWNITLKDE